MKKKTKKIIRLFILFFIIIVAVAVCIYFGKKLISSPIKKEEPKEETNTPSNVEKDPILEALVKDSYYKEKNKDRYLAYQKLHSDLLPKEVIASVNSNIDFDFYTNIKKTDMSKELLILVNKYYTLSDMYTPDDLVYIDSKYGIENGRLRKIAYDNMKKLIDDAKDLNLNIYIRSPFRNYSVQNYLYNSYGKTHGYDEADTFSARPGHSEHQTGLVADVAKGSSGSIDDFGSTHEYEWMKNNAHKYGFIVRFPENKEHITGYIFEPWHYRFVGIDVASYIYQHNITFEEYYSFYLE